jgi:hypothetical protein
MKRPKLRWLQAAFSLLLLSLGTASAQSRPSRSDVQSWNDVQVSVALNKTIDFVLLGTLRIGRNLHRPVDERVGLGFSFKAGKYLTFAPNYLHITTQPFKGRSVYENRLSFPATIRFPAGQFTVSDRNLFERRLRHPGGDSTRYRNKLQVDHPIGDKNKKLNFFVADEVFYDWSFNAWVRNRFSVGINKALNKHVTTDLYYLRQNDGHSVPGDIHVIGTLWRIRP